MENKKLYECFRQMKKRCYNPSDRDFQYYGAKNINICVEWLTNEKSFINWALTNGYKEGLLIDRIDNAKSYSPDNCKWSTRTESNRNKTSVLLINGLTLNQHCQLKKLPYKTIYDRIKAGWEINDALNIPIKRGQKYKEVRS